MKNKGFTLTELTIVMAIIAALTVAVLTWFLTFKDTKQEDKNGDGLIYYDDLVLPDPPDYRAILEKYGIDCDNLSDDEIIKLVKELQND
uniref:Type II secretion system protein n=1 Tax=Podoviridae sp. ctaNW81 TaxID=2826562 RepID=A0A8S5M547_9CAUD|nr:MAG TPA: type II secretion system protein [Podoviridae sp. ctaNW81]